MANTNKRADILATAEELVNGERAQSYGPPEENFGRIAQLWNAMGFAVRADGPGEDIRYRDVDATDVAMAQIQIKMARLVTSPAHEDNWVDIAGYAGLGGEIALPGIMKKGAVRESNARKPGFIALDSGYYQCDRCHETVAQSVLLDHSKNRHGFDEYVLL